MLVGVSTGGPRTLEQWDEYLGGVSYRITLKNGGEKIQFNKAANACRCVRHRNWIRRHKDEVGAVVDRLVDGARRAVAGEELLFLLELQAVDEAVADVRQQHAVPVSGDAFDGKQRSGDAVAILQAAGMPLLDGLLSELVCGELVAA